MDIITITLEVLLVIVILLAVTCIVRIIVSLSVPKWKVPEDGLFWMTVALFFIAGLITEILISPPFLLKK